MQRQLHTGRLPTASLAPVAASEMHRTALRRAADSGFASAPQEQTEHPVLASRPLLAGGVWLVPRAPPSVLTERIDVSHILVYEACLLIKINYNDH